MSEFDQLDKKIAEKLEQFFETPPQGVWKNIRSGLDNAPPGPTAKASFFSGNPVTWRAAAAAVIIATVIFYLITPEPDMQPAYEQRQSEISFVDPQNPAAIEEVSSSREGKELADKSESGLNSTNNEITPDENSIVVASDMKINTTEKAGVTISQDQKPGVENVIGAPKEKSDKIPLQKNQSAELIASKKRKAPEPVNTQSEITGEPVIKSPEPEPAIVAAREQEKQESLPRQSEEEMNKIPQKKPLYAEAANPTLSRKLARRKVPAGNYYFSDDSSPLSLGIYGSIDRIYNTADALSGANDAYGLGIAVRYTISDRHFLESGLGSYQSEDGWNYEVEYRSNELMGYYTNVDTVTCDIVAGSQGQDSVIINYFTSQKAVYDSVDISSSEITTIKYTYLTVPLLIGYQNNIRNFQYSVSTGLTMSVVLHEKTEPADFDKDNVNVLHVNHEVYNRIEMNWHYTLNLGAGYRFNDHWSFVVEPRLRVYLKDLYETSPAIETKRPYSIGLGGGVFYRF